jgi:hypothetical protein
MTRQQNPDRMLAAALYGHARRLAVNAGSITEAQAFLEQRAAGRYDLLAQEAGSAAGDWTITVQRSHPVELLAAGLLVTSGPVDLTEVARWLEVGRRRAAAPKHGTH